MPPSSLLDPFADETALVSTQPDATSVQVAAPVASDVTDDPNVVLLTAPQQTTGGEVTQSASEGAPQDSLLLAAPVGNAGPQITNFKGVEVVGGLWRFTGDVIAGAPGGMTVSFGGEPVSLQNKTALTDANGHFEAAFLMNTDGSDNGLASARTVDGAGLVSNIALYNISPG